MDDEIRRVEAQIRKVEDQIEKVSQAIDGFYDLKSRSASFDLVMEGKFQDLRKEKEDLRKEKEDLRKKELLLLEISKNESESKALIYSLQYSTKLSSS